MKNEARESIALFSKWFIVSTVTGVVSALLVFLMIWLLKGTSNVLSRVPGRLEWLIPAAGALLVGALIIGIAPESGGEGVPVYIMSVNRRNGIFKTAAALLKFPATVFTLALRFSGGIVGPLVHISAGCSSFLADHVFKRLKMLGEDDIRIASICGASGAVSAIFHSPLGGTLFAAEILHSESMQYIDLIPALMAGVVSVMVSIFALESHPFVVVHAPHIIPAWHSFIWLPVVAAFSGGVGMLFIFFFNRLSELFRRIAPHQPYTALLGGGFVALISYLNADWALGTSTGVPEAIVNGSLEDIYTSFFSFGNVSVFLVILIAAKAVTTSITVGSGMSGGFTGPLIIMGLASGALASSIMHIHAGSIAYHAFLACGMAAILGAVMNIPLAAIVITTKIFGTSYILPALIGGTVAFALFKSKSIYQYK